MVGAWPGGRGKEGAPNGGGRQQESALTQGAIRSCLQLTPMAPFSWRFALFSCSLAFFPCGKHWVTLFPIRTADTECAAIIARSMRSLQVNRHSGHVPQAQATSLQAIDHCARKDRPNVGTGWRSSKGRHRDHRAVHVRSAWPQMRWPWGRIQGVSIDRIVRVAVKGNGQPLGLGWGRVTGRKF